MEKIEKIRMSSLYGKMDVPLDESDILADACCLSDEGRSWRR